LRVVNSRLKLASGLDWLWFARVRYQVAQEGIRR